MKSKLDWKGIGQFMCVLGNLIKIITTTMKEAEVTIEIMEWLTGPGKSRFEVMLKSLGVDYKKSIPAEVPEKSAPSGPYVIHRAEVDLSVDPKLPFTGATYESHARGNQKALVELRSDDNLYVDGRKIILYCEPGQLDGKVTQGHLLQDALTGKYLENAALLDFLLEHAEFIPHHWKKDRTGNTRYIFFWGTVYRRADGNLYVRYLCWHGGRWGWNYRWLGGDFGVSNPAAVSAS